MGKMSESTRKTMPSYGFGTARRESNSVIRSPRAQKQKSPRSSPRSSPRKSTNKK